MYLTVGDFLTSWIIMIMIMMAGMMIMMMLMMILKEPRNSEVKHGHNDVFFTLHPARRGCEIPRVTLYRLAGPYTTLQCYPWDILTK